MGFTESLSKLFESATPLVSAVVGNKAGVSNASPVPGTPAPANGQMRTNAPDNRMLIILGGVALAVVGGLVWWMSRKGK